MDLEDWLICLKVFVDVICVCLLVLLEQEELIVVELLVIIRLVQLCVFIYLVCLKEVGLVCDCCVGVLVYYCFDEVQLDLVQCVLWYVLSNGSDDLLLCQDVECVVVVLVYCVFDQNWVDSVVGDMECYYFLGCIWEVLVCIVLLLFEIGDVLDIVFGDGVLVELVVLYFKCYICIDISVCVVVVVSECLWWLFNVEVCEGDMYVLLFKDVSFDLVVLMYVLIYVSKLVQVVIEVVCVLCLGGCLLLCSLVCYEYKVVVEVYGYVNFGFSDKELCRFVDKVGLQVFSLEMVMCEKCLLYFEVILLIVNKF